ncbi:Penicillin-binding protein 4* [Alphaproteobacteria bacterium SO-S41]|nr:Penicillin-binding protein 4* [Alphaproteobacteria bacterium SO-S41]
MSARAGLLAAALLIAAPLASAAPTERDIDAVVAPVVGTDTPGLAILVAQNGKTLVTKGYGLADIARRTPVTADTAFDLASLSKEMTALIALRFAKAGKLDLAAPIDRVLPSFKQHDGGRAITAGDLIHHVAGLPDYEDLYEPQMTNADVVAWANDQELDFAPGTDFNYSNTGYVVLASALMQIAGAADFNTILQREIFMPLGMTHTRAPEGLAPTATGYAGDDGDFDISLAPSPITCDGSVFASIGDLARYETALASGKLADAATMKLLFANGTFDSGEPIDDGDSEGYGFGWVVSDDGRVVSHRGSWFGAANFYLRDLPTGITVIVLANNESFDAEGMACAIANLYGAC